MARFCAAIPAAVARPAGREPHPRACVGFVAPAAVLVPSWDTPHGSLLDVVEFIVVATASAVIFTWVFNNTRGSVLMAILAHASINAFGTYLIGAFPAPIMTASSVGWGTGIMVAAVLIIVLTRGNLGYREDEPELSAAPT